MAKNSIVKEDSGHNYLPVVQGIPETQALIQANIGSDDIGAFDLERAVNPSGKSVLWTIPGLGEEPETVSELEGIIIFHKSVRAYWVGEYKGGGTPPDCSSADSITGVGDPGGRCHECPFKEFGSGKNNSQACKQIKRLFLLREGELLPMLVNITPGNYNDVKNFLIRLLSKKQLKYNAIVVKLKNVSDVSTSGFDYAKVVVSMVKALPPEMAEQIDQLTEILTPHLDAIASTEDIGDVVQDPDF